MDTVLSNSTLFPRPLLPVRITLNSTTTYFCKKLQKRRVVRFRKNPCADTVVVAVGNNKSSTIITCGGGIREIEEKEFSDAVLKSDRLVLVEFVANWCGPCRLISPAIESIAQVFNLSIYFYIYLLHCYTKYHLHSNPKVSLLAE